MRTTREVDYFFLRLKLNPLNSNLAVGFYTAVSESLRPTNYLYTVNYAICVPPCEINDIEVVRGAVCKIS